MSLVACLGPMREMGMNVKHPATITRPQTLRYLIFGLDLNYIMGSQQPWTVFELLDLLSAVIIKELELFRVRLDIFIH